MELGVVAVSGETSPPEKMSRRETAPDTRLISFASALHPSGAVNRVRVIDGEASQGNSDQPADVVLLALGSATSAGPRPLEPIIEEAAAALAPGGIFYLLGPPRVRKLALRLLRRRGYDGGEHILHLNSGAAQFYVPFTAKSLRFATRSWPFARRWTIVAAILRLLPGATSVLRSLLPTIGIAVRPPGALEFSWLLSRLPQTHGSEALVATSWRPTEGSTIVFAFAAEDRSPVLVAKQPSRAKLAASLYEATMLDEVARTAGEAGVGVPRFLEFVDRRRQPYLLETGVAGRPASEILKKRPEALRHVVDRMALWLRSWHCSTLHNAPLTAAACDEMILAPARSLVPVVSSGHDYYSWLEQFASELIGVEVPWVNAHNDLSMVNVLLLESGELSVVDWETATPRGLPLADFWYAACDASTCGKPRERAVMFEQCFIAEGGIKDLLASHEQCLRSAVGGPEKWIRLCFHACWLQHAVNERAQQVAGRPSPFVAIANMLPSFSRDR